MIYHVRQSISRGSPVRGVVLAVALALGAGVWQAAQAVDVGHARILSGAGQPLRLIVPLTGLSSDEAATLAVRLADAAAWRQSGLTPPVALADLDVAVQLGANASRRDLIVTAAEVPRGDVVDMLLELETSAGKRRIQVSFVVPAQAAPGMTNIQPPRTVIVRRGDTLSGIAQTHRYAGVSLYQMLAALYQANPQAFIQNNMNRVKAGATLAIPDAETVRAIDPAEARRLFLAHSAAFARYRADMAGTVSVVMEEAPDSGQLETAPIASPEQSVAAGDRLRLSSDTPSAATEEQAADEQIALVHAEQEIADRLAELERNIGDLHQALSTERGAPGIQMDSAADDGVLRQEGEQRTEAPMPPAVVAAEDSSLLADALPIQNDAGASAAAATDSFASPAVTLDASPPLTSPSLSDSSLPDAAGEASEAVAEAADAVGAVSEAVVEVSEATGAVSEVAEEASEATGAVSESVEEVPEVARAVSEVAGTVSEAVGEVLEATGAVSGVAQPDDDVRQPDNLLVWITGLLAALALIIAWVMRRTGVRGTEHDDDDLADDDAPTEPSDAQRAQFASRLESIDLNLSDSLAESGHWSRR